MRMRLLVLLALVATASADPRFARPFPPAAAKALPSLAPDDVEAIWGIDHAPIRIEQIQILEQLIADTQDVEERADYLYRLAIIHTKLAMRERGTEKGKASLLAGVKTFRELVDDDRLRGDPKRDMALFHYGYLLQSGRYMKEARAVYDRLLEKFPESKYVPLAHLAFAEYHFDAGQLADAEARYRMVLKFPKSVAYAYAMYKLGWTALGLQRPREALQVMTQVLALTGNDRKQAALAAAARKDRDALQVTPADPPDAAWIAGRYADAGRAYAAIASDLDTPNDKAREAARNAVAAFENALGIDPDPIAQLGAIELKPRKPRAKLSETERAMLDAFAMYAALVRDSRDEHLGAMRLVEAGVFRAHGDHAHAVPVLVDYLHWNAQLAEPAARALVDSLVAQGKQDEALAIVARWATEDFLTGKAGLARDVDLIRSRSPRR
jgi:tetratricopeptide (TPR) repeat protein